MKITPNQDFKHKGESYKKGKEYDVAPEDAHYFTGAGWAGEAPKGKKAQSLEIDSGTIGHKSEVK